SGVSIGAVDGLTGVVVVELDLECLSGSVTQTEAIRAAGVRIISADSAILDAPGNLVDRVAGGVPHTFAWNFGAHGSSIGTVGGVSGVSAALVSFNVGGPVTQTQAIHTGGIELSGYNLCTYTLGNPANRLSAVWGSSPGDLYIADGSDLRVGRTFVPSIGLVT